MAEIIWTRSALKDLRDIHQFISADSIYYADRLVTILYDRANILIHYPRAGRMVPEKEDATIRELIEGNCYYSAAIIKATDYTDKHYQHMKEFLYKNETLFYNSFLYLICVICG